MLRRHRHVIGSFSDIFDFHKLKIYLTCPCVRLYNIVQKRENSTRLKHSMKIDELYNLAANEDHSDPDMTLKKKRKSDPTVKKTGSGYYPRI